jgi:DNA-binding transcriptional LysR family regulator
MRHLQSLRYVDAVARAGSIRKAAETLAIDSTALNRRILAFEQELGTDIFERLPRGVRLSAAGEILLNHIRSQLADIERVKSQINDLAGERRGHVAIACSQALLPFFLPEQIAQYRHTHPAVTFSVALRDRAAAEQSLVDLSADLALVFEPVRLSELQILLSVKQPVYAVMNPDHPLATKTKLRLRECLTYPISLPSPGIGVREMLETAGRRLSAKVRPVVESDNFEFLRRIALAEGSITFQIPIGLPTKHQAEAANVVTIPLDERDVPPGILYVAQLRGRTLPVTSAGFANQILNTFEDRYECD